jgi:hypothetical protein
MPIFNVVGEWDSIDEQFLRPGRQCFRCGAVLADDVLVYVLGFPYSAERRSDAQIWLHQDCALNLSAALAQDVLQARNLLLQKT